ncbi:MAG: GNAT family N-acetyltransferase [Betaproteobacteria bacterium]
MRAEIHDRADALAKLRAPWRDLESRALEPNAYLSARFVLPALACLPTSAPAWAVSIQDGKTAAGRLCGLGVFQARAPRLRFPFPHAQVYASPHSFLGGILLDAETAHPALHAMLDALARRTSGLRLEDLNATGATAQLLQAVMAERGASWHEEVRVERACILPALGGSIRWRQHASASKLRDHDRQWRKLTELGRASWHYLRGDQVQDRTIDTFIELEHAGWKGAQGTSLRSDPRQVTFFREMTRAFRADGDVFFTELRLQDQVIASTCNLRSGCNGFAFKVCFDPCYSKYSPGMLNELGFLKALENAVDDFRFIDSGAEPGSFIEKLWPDRITLLSGSIALGGLSRAAARAAHALSLVRRRLMAGPAPALPQGGGTS